ncbi:Bax inhibitor-1/YccA family protein [Kangiella aquimarina]|uniref:Bax inhibitor-1 family protein n=1 Tax=Kangiella aquimarina TaxID=261965 RepID=A0ABZ0X6Y6_9GAMM|nr:Bax inhibitor-1 family protein [Kangiella aquimarina]WQG86129.1 Bax inhibitor-1 family protein [Kangiella aquimarina]
MSYQQTEEQVVVRGGLGDRAKFITKTYNHLLGAIFAFVLISVGLYESGASVAIYNFFAQLGTFGMIAMMLAFVGTGWFAAHFADRATSKGVQYLNLVIFTAAYAVFFSPLLLLAATKAPGVIQSAAVVTLVGAGILTAIVFYTRKDFSFLRGIVMWGFGLGLLAILGGAIFGFHLGTWFSVAMIGISGAAILYDTSNILHHYPEDRYVGAAISLFSSIAMMFIYVLRLFLASEE